MSMLHTCRAVSRKITKVTSLVLDDIFLLWVLVSNKFNHKIINLKATEVRM